MRADTWCLRLTKRGWTGVYRTYLAFRDGMYFDQTPYRGSSARFDSEAEAAQFGDDMVRTRRAVSYEVEHIPADAPLHGTRHTPTRSHRNDQEPETRTDPARPRARPSTAKSAARENGPSRWTPSTPPSPAQPAPTA